MRLRLDRRTWVTLLVCAVAAVLFLVLGFDRLEVVGVMTGVVAVWWAIEVRTENWPVAIVNATVFTIVFFRIGAPGNAVLQLFIICLCIYGWVQWVRGQSPSNASRFSWGRSTDRWIGFGLVAATTAGLLAFSSSRSWAALFDALSTGVGVAALFLQGRKRLDHWVLWIVQTLIQIPLFITNASSFLTAATVPFLGLYGFGLWRWVNKSKPLVDRAEVSMPDPGFVGGE